ncbi:PAS domain S-box protein [Winogradskyella litoriviva]|uniref:histidine kinase n=1 Tax=Winogradskyella litoriviva TaxID=1220182 RepID=A0ABX2E2C9_9FLAO|nr:PAS domain S-box protein [Winogradskyella litoriviva]NRD22648.1 PAS domain S-box protein [Winogradskyella litoriviva]
MAPLFMLVGAIHFFQSNFGKLFSVEILDDVIIYPISSILFVCILFTVLLIYIKEGVTSTKAVITGIVITNLILSLLVLFINRHQPESLTSELIFNIHLKSVFINTFLGLAELLMLVILYQTLINRLKKTSLIFVLILSLLAVSIFHSVVYNVIYNFNNSALTTLITSQTIANSILALCYGILLYVYLKYFDIRKTHFKFISNKNIDIFSILKFNKTSANQYVKNENDNQKIFFDIESTLNNISDGFISLDSNWYYTYINKKAADLLGRTPESLIGKHIWTEFPEGIGRSFYKAYYKAVETQETIYFEDYYEPLDKWFENRVYPTEDGITIYFRDITEKIQADSHNHKLGSLINSSEQFIGLASLEGKPFYLNSNGRALVGLAENEDLPETIYKFYPPEYKHEVKNQQMSEVFNNEKWTGETHFINFKTNKLIPVEVSRFLIRDSNSNSPIALGIVATDITERKASENEILDIQQKMQAAIRIGNIGHWSWDISKDEVYWSDFMYKIYDVPKDTVIEYNTASNCVHPEDKKVYNEISAQRIKDKSNKPFEYRILSKDGSIKYVMVQMEVVETPSGVPIKFHGTVIDVTERKTAEEKLANSELLFRQLTTTAPVGMFRMQLDGSCNFVNQQWEEYACMSYNDAMGFGWTNAIHPDDRERVLNAWMKIVPTGKDFNVDFRFLNPDGKILWMTVKAVGNYNSSNKLYGYIGICLDVSETKLAQENLKKSEKLFKRLTSKAPVGIFQTDAEGACNYVNDKWLQHSGLAYEEAMGAGWANALHPDDLDRIVKEWQNYLLTDETELKTHFRFLHKNDNVVWVTVKTVATFDAENNLNGYIGMTIDVTESKQAEENLINSELLFRGLSTHAPVGIFKTDKVGVCNFVNAEWINYSGLSFDQAMGLGWTSALHKEDKDRVIKSWQISIQKQKEFITDCRFETKEGIVTWLSVKAVCYYDTNNNLNGYIGMCVDITERKLAEEQLKTNEKYLENILNNIGDPVFVKDEQSRMILVNDALCSIFSMSRENILGKTMAENVPMEERNRFLANDRHIIETGIENVNEETVSLNNTELRSISTKKTRFIDSNGNKYIIGVIRDITERKKAENEIAEMQGKIEAAIRIGNIGYWSWDIEKDEVYWSDLMYDIYDVDRGAKLKYDTVLSRVHPEDRDFHDKITQDRILSKNTDPFEYRVLCTDQRVKYVTVQTEVIEDEQGNAIKFQGTVLDITEKKKAEIKLINSEKLFKRLISNAPIAILQSDKYGLCNYVNKEWLNYTGQTFEEAMEFGFVKAVHPDDREDVINKWKQAVATEENVNIVYRCLKKDDSISWLLNNSVKIYNANNEFSGFISSVIDITEAKKAEEIELKSKQYLNDILNNIGDPVFVKNSESKLILVNDALCNVFGLPREEILGKTLGERKPAKERETLFKIEKHILETGEEVVNEETVSLNFKEPRTFSIKKTRYIDNDSNKLIIGVLRDITERKKVEEEIRKTHQRLTTHLNNSPLAVIEWDKEFNITNWSVQAENIFGWDEQEVIGKHFREFNLVYNEDEFLISKFYNDLKNGKVNYNRVINRNNTKENKVIYCEWYNSVLLCPKGNIESYFSIVLDVTERIEIEKSIAESEEKFSKVFHSSLIGYSIINSDQIRVDVNETMAKMLESTRAHLIGKTMEDANVDRLDDFYYDQKSRLFKKLMKDGFLNNETVDRVLVSGKKISLLCSVEAIEIAGETHALFAVIDNTENKITETELENYRNNLEELVEIRTEEVKSKNIQLERMNKMFVGRELKMRDLKKVIKDLKNKYED